MLRLVLKLRPGYVSPLQRGQEELAPLLPLGVSDPRIILAINSDAPALFYFSSSLIKGGLLLLGLPPPSPVDRLRTTE